MLNMTLLCVFIGLVLPALYVVYNVLVAPRFSPIRLLPGPPAPKWPGNHLRNVLDPNVAPRMHEYYVQKYGRSFRIRGLGPWDERLMTVDPLAITHVLKSTNIYEKPWQSRKLITSLIGCGLLSAEGQTHKRQRRVVVPAFSGQNMRSLVHVVFRKGEQVKDTWMNMIAQNAPGDQKSMSVRIEVSQWLSRATFDVIGLAGFGYNFNAIRDETNELFKAYKNMFEVAISQGQPLRTALYIYMPFLFKLFVSGNEELLLIFLTSCGALIKPDAPMRAVNQGVEVIHRVAGRLVQERKQKIKEGEMSGNPYDGKDILSLLLKANASTDLQPEDRISDEDILNNINTMMFAGSDTSSLTMTWTLFLLARHPTIQTRLRAELLSIAPASSPDLSTLTEDEIQSLHAAIADLPFLHNVTRESLRLISPIHSSLRVAMQDDVIPTQYSLRNRDGTIEETKHSIVIPKGTFVHVPVEAFHLDKSIWGPDAWEFNPDRWDALPPAVLELPGYFSNLLTFSAGPRSCPGMRFALIEMKMLYFILLTSFVFRETEEKVVKHNVVLTRPYISGKFSEGTQCPLLVSRCVPGQNE